MIFSRILFNFIILTLIISGWLIFLCSCSSERQENNPNKENSIPTNKAELTVSKISFPSQDCLMVTGNLYLAADRNEVIVLCHQAGFNKFEYSGIGKRLQEMGYNCLAIDQRSGGPLIEEWNETKLMAEKSGKPTDFLDAAQDITSAVNFASKKFGKKIILWGSSYSSTLALFEAISNDNVKAVISFSPGDYFQKEKGILKSLLKEFKKPMFVTSSREESVELKQMLSEMKKNSEQIQFIPDSAGYHGSRALWKTNKNNEEYWEAIIKFLKSIKP